MRNTVLKIAALVVGGAMSLPQPAPGLELDQSIRLEAKAAMRRGTAYLSRAQLNNGSWANHPVVTSLVSVALANLPDAIETPVTLDSALDYLASQAHENGAIWNRQTQQYPLYSTALSMLGLVRQGRPRDRYLLEAARHYLIANQRNEGERGDPAFGGFAENNRGMPSLTVTQWALEALYLTDYLEENPERAVQVYNDALVFIMRCQAGMGSESAGNKVGPGCFRDYPVSERGNEFEPVSGTPRSPAFLTCIGLKSLIYARSQIDNPAVQSGLACLQQVYTVSENPGLGEKGLYTYLFALSKALRALDRDIFMDAAGNEHFWRRDIVLELLGRQVGDGSWRQATPAWWENHPELATAYALLIMERCVEF